MNYKSYKTEFTTRKIAFDYGNFHLLVELKCTLISLKKPKKLVSGDLVKVSINASENLSLLDGNTKNDVYECTVWFSGQGIHRTINFTRLDGDRHYMTFYSSADIS